MIPIEGKQIIGKSLSAKGKETFQSTNPALGLHLHYKFFKATEEEVSEACEKASKAFQFYRKKTGIEKANFLDTIVVELKNIADQLIDTCCTETALSKVRIEGELGRTINQILMFSTMLREGSWLDARIDTAIADRTPLPKPDIRYMHVGIGPVVVFGASNFPLAFSVGGGDTISALAAGCPVIVKAHSAHPATGELVGKAIQLAATNTGMPDGVFSLLHGDGTTTGVSLVKNENIKAVGLTGSFKAGKALYDIAAKRQQPIPVYAEMGSTNPVFILPEAMNLNYENIAKGYSASVTLGVGQFCTNPGLLIYDITAHDTSFTSELKKQFEDTSGGAMLSEVIFKSYKERISSAHERLDLLAEGNQVEGVNYARPFLFKTGSDVFNSDHELSEEIFGPASIVVEARSRAEMLSIAQNLSGHLTATVHGTENDLINYKDLIDILEQKAGRIVFNGFPTGVEVCHAMVHGGPFPSTTDGRSTSVGSASIFRFTRAVCYQNMPQTLLPAELKNENALGIWRLVDGKRTQDSL